MSFFGPNKSTAQDVHEFHQSLQKKEGLRWSDYEKIQRIRKDDIPALKKYLEDEIRRIQDVKMNPDGTERTQAQKNIEATDWKLYLASVTALETAWKKGELKVEKHREENYSAIVEKTRAKLKELFGEASEISATAPVAPAKPVSVTEGGSGAQKAEKPTEDQKLQELKGMRYVVNGKVVSLVGVPLIKDGIYQIALELEDKDKTQIFRFTKDAQGNLIPIGPAQDGYTITINSTTKEVQFTSSKTPSNSTATEVVPPTTAAKPASVPTPATNASTSQVTQTNGTSAPAAAPVASTAQASRKKVALKDRTPNEILEHNQRYVAKHLNSLDFTNTPNIKTYLDNPSVDNIKDLQEKTLKITPSDGIIGSNTSKAISDLVTAVNWARTGKSPAKSVNEGVDKNRVILTEATRFMQKMLDSPKFQDDFTEQKGRPKKRVILKDPFSLIWIAGFPHQENDLQMEDNSPVFRYIRNIFTKDTLKEWRALPTQDKIHIKRELNKNWNEQAKAKLDELSLKGKVKIQMGTAKTPPSKPTTPDVPVPPTPDVPVPPTSDVPVPPTSDVPVP